MGPFEYKPDFEDVLNRYEAWWDCQVLDRPLTSIAFSKPESERVPSPKKEHASIRDRWMDTGFKVAGASAWMDNTVWFADALPIAWPNLGPEIFSAFYGCPMEYGASTAWSEPVLEDWSPESVNKLQMDKDGFYFKKVIEMTNAFLEAAKGKFIVGYTDLHGGGDAIAAFRDPQKLCIDTIEYPEEIKALGNRITDDFLEVYDLYHDMLAAAGMPSTTWLGATCRGKYHVPSNDFSCMISDDMFEDLFIPGIIRECQHMDRCIYHLDGPQALRYLDRLLAIPEIHGIQWVPGAGQDHWTEWIEVYRRIQKAQKAFCLHVPAGELGQLFDVLKPEGAWVTVGDIKDPESANAALKAISKWGI